MPRRKTMARLNSQAKRAGSLNDTDWTSSDPQWMTQSDTLVPSNPLRHQNRLFVRLCVRFLHCRSLVRATLTLNSDVGIVLFNVVVSPWNDRQWMGRWWIGSTLENWKEKKVAFHKNREKIEASIDFSAARRNRTIIYFNENRQPLDFSSFYLSLLLYFSPPLFSFLHTTRYLAGKLQAK